MEELLPFYKRRNDFRDYLWNRLDDYIDFIGRGKFMKENTDELFNNYLQFTRNRLKIDLLRDEEK
jgi:hypothetical protein